MNATSTTESTTTQTATPAFVPDCYYIYQSGHRSHYTPCRVIRSTKTTTVAVAANGKERTFTGVQVPNSNVQLNERGDKFNPGVLSFNVAACEGQISQEVKRRELSRRYNAAKEAIEKALQGQKNGMGQFVGDEAYVAKLEAAAAML